MAVTPTGSALSMLILTILLLAIAWCVMILRIMTRLWIKGLGTDDYLMCIGHILFTITGAAIIACAFTGVGTMSEFLTLEDIIQAHKFFMLGQLFYTVATVFIKASICFAMLRITTRKVYVWILYAVMVLTTVASLITVIAVLTFCRPIAASYDPSVKGECGNPQTVTNASYFISSVSILTDWTCAILPAFIVWEVQLSSRVKASVAVVLGLGVFASSATLVRLPYLVAYSDPFDPEYLYKIAVIAIWSCVELGIAIIAASLATLRPLLKYVPFMRSTVSGSSNNKTANTGLEGGMGGRSRGGAGITSHAMHAIHRNETTIQGGTGGKHRAGGGGGGGDGDWQQLSDSDSQKGILTEGQGIKVTRDVRLKTAVVTMEEAAEAREHDSRRGSPY